jgi:hypothetical protein
MDKMLKYLKTEAIGGQVIRFSLAGLLLFGGFAKLTLIGDLGYNIGGALIISAIETLSAMGLLYHFKRPLMGIVGGFLAFISILIRLIYSLHWIKSDVIDGDSIWGAIQHILSLFNNGLFYIILLFGAAIYCMGNSYKAYVHGRITKPWPG